MGAPSAGGHDVLGELRLCRHFSAHERTEWHISFSWCGVLLGLTIDVKSHVASCACSGKNEHAM